MDSTKQVTNGVLIYMGVKEFSTLRLTIGTNSVYLLWLLNYHLNKMDIYKIIDSNHLLHQDKTVTLNITLMERIILKPFITKYLMPKVKYLLLVGC